MNLLVTPRCACIRTASGATLALCSYCRARLDPEFARRCVEHVGRKTPEPKQRRKRRR